MARDLAARLGVPFTLPEPRVPTTGAAPVGELASVEIVDPDLCGRFVAWVLRDVTVGAVAELAMATAADAAGHAARSTTWSTSPTT